MRILYLTRGQSPHDLRFLQALAGTDYQTAVLCLEASAQLQWPEGIQQLAWTGKKVSANWMQNLHSAQALKQIAAEFQPDVIHAGPIQRVAFLAALAGIRPLLSMSWGSDLLLEAQQSLNWRWITRYTLQRSTMLAADCQTVVRKARSFGYTGPVVVFPWGVDLDHFTPGAPGGLRRQLGWEKEKVFLSNRTMEPLYGVEVVARAFACASQSDDHLRLLLFGKGSQKPEIITILKEAAAVGKVYYGGFASLDELPEIYRSADYYVSASHSDGSSVSLMEALACGKPALVSDIPSNQEWIEAGKTGWLFRDGDERELAQIMLTADFGSSYNQLAKNARKLAEERADWKKNFKKLLAAYQQLAEKKNFSS